jgi:hypothetical protein
MYREREILPIKLNIRTTPFLLEKETGLYLKEKSNPCSLLPQTLSPYQRGQNAPPEERRFPIPSVAARGRQRFSSKINRPVMLLSPFMVGNGLDRSEKAERVAVPSKTFFTENFLRTQKPTRKTRKC